MLKYMEGWKKGTMNPFDSKAVVWDDHPVRRELTLQISAAIQAVVTLEKTMSAMEFGCGTGLISRELFPMLGKLMAIDLSPGMIAQLQKRIDEANLKTITARCLDIFTDPPDETFDLIFSAMALHHIPDTDAVLDQLAGLLKPGGQIALADLDTEDGTFHGADAGPVHHGFDREGLMKKIRDRGLIETAVVTAHTLCKNGNEYSVFLITARKPSESFSRDGNR
jgi:ubiquinone/menaquinone biosynthesis C-methylase UbiE